MNKRTFVIQGWNIILTEQSMIDEAPSGDGVLVIEMPDGILLSIVDGLGHGTEAHYACQCCLTEVIAHYDLEMIDLVKIVHDRIKGSRGVAIGLLKINENTVEWLGVGNISIFMVNGEHQYLSSFSQSGIVGFILPRLIVRSFKDIRNVVLFTDGLISTWDQIQDWNVMPDISDLSSSQWKLLNDDKALIIGSRYG